MATDFSYNGKTIDSNGGFKPSGKNTPIDVRTRVNTFADIASIPVPYIGMIITVLEDETNSNKMTDYKVLSLKANASGIANSVIDQVQRYVDYLGASSGGSISQEDINTAINNYFVEHPVQNGATTEQAAQIQANKTAIDGLTKEVNDIKNTELENLNTAINTLETVIGDKTGLPSGDANVIASINRIDEKTGSGSGLTDEQLNKLNSIDNKVDKVKGKTLTTNDYTNEEKQTVASLKTTVGDTSSGLVKDVTDLKNNGVSQDNINSAVEKYMQNNPIKTEDYDPNNVFFIGNMDTNITTDGLVIWLYKDIVQDRILYDLSGNDNDVALNPGVSVTNNGISVNSDNGIVYSIIDIPETEIITMEFTAKITGAEITGSGATPITTYDLGGKCGMKICISNNLYTTANVMCESGSGTFKSKTGGNTSLIRIPGIVFNKPFHFLFRYNSELARVDIFVDGVNNDYYIDVSSVGAPKLTVSKLGFFTRGIEGNPINNFKNFEIYDIKAYNKMLSDEEILINYNNLIKNGVIVNEQ